MPSHYREGSEERNEEEKQSETQEAGKVMEELGVDEETLLKQIESEYKFCWRALESKKTEWLRRLKLYNNQARERSKVGDPLLFTVFQTVFSALYTDKLSVEFEPNQDGDEHRAENATMLAGHDYRVMHKEELDYDWDWDACFFGRGLMLEHEFSKESSVMAPVPEVIDPTTFLRDPHASSVNGHWGGRGAMRFGGFEAGIMKDDMKDNPSYIQENLKHLKREAGVNSLKEESQQQRQSAQNVQTTKFDDRSIDENYEYTVLHWFTHVKGKKVIVSLANNRQLVVRLEKLETPRWPIIDRSIFPMSHEWDGVSIPDLIEDKQRARAKMINLGMDSAISDLYPMYLYNKKKIRNKRDLDFGFNKMVGVSGDVNNAISPVQKSQFHQQVNLILNMLDVSAQKAIAAPEIAQGVQPKDERTLGELELVSAARGARMSLAASVFGWSERRFWQQWYYLYKKHFKDEFEEKVIRIRGPLSTRFRHFKRNDIIGYTDPDIYIESKRVAEARQQKEFQEFSQYAQMVSQSEGVNRRFIERKLGKILNLSDEDLSLMFPATIDELIAEDENKKLQDNELPKGEAWHDDAIHIEIHRKVEETPALLAHIEFHKRMLAEKKQRPELFQQQQEQETRIKGGTDQMQFTRPQQNRASQMEQRKNLFQREEFQGANQEQVGQP